MRYELADNEWSAIRPMLPNKPRGVPRVNDRRVLNGIFWVLRSRAPWRDLPDDFGPYTTCYNRFVRWRRAGVWAKIMNAFAGAHDAAVQMIDTSIVRVHQHGACITRNRRQSMGRSRGGLTSKIHALVDANGLPVRLALTAGEAHDNRLAGKLLSRLKSGTMLLADRGYDADWIRCLVRQHGAWANIPPKRNRTEALCFSPYLEFGSTDTDLAALRAKSGGAQHKALIERLRHAQAANEIGANVDIERAARFVETTMFGLQVAAKAGASLQSLRDTAAFAIASLRNQ
jgi:transposase